MRFLIIVGLIIFMGVGCVSGEWEQGVIGANMGDQGQDGQEFGERACESVGGVWEACGSACRGREIDVCITVCVEQCLCVSEVQCPEGMVCGEFIDQEGICLPNE